MLTDRFIKEFRSHSNNELFSFNSFFQTLASQTPPKVKIVMSNGYDASTGREAILINFYKNPQFRSIDVFARSTVEKFVQFLESKDCENPSYECQLIFMVHCSKAKAEYSFFETVFKNFNTIKIVEYKDSYLENLLLKIKQNDTIVKAIKSSVFDFGAKHIDKDDLKPIMVVFFEAQLNILNGFASMDKIYINLTKINFLLETIEYYGKKQNNDLILGLYFTRLAIHEMTHVLLRRKLNDLNVSSPFLEQKNMEILGNDFLESGYIAEKKIFGAKIDFFRGLEILNFDYLNNFFRDVMENKSTLNFDLKISRCQISESVPIMAVDIDIRKKREYE
ncbi:unnamed protein product [Brachionus calyciflorus]|uniref:Uncharacterized protein n=1 Tax=Brachionus calyciflorus TaxID=104777 RepID=A0A813M224_9BILA|nr:unnamed protein product [Brachionus calyciflorus]